MNAFLMVGQSNMSGRGGLKELPDISNPHVRVWRGEGWETAVEPVVRDKPAIAAAGMGSAFGTSVYMMTGEDVGLIPCSLGGSRLREWQPGERLFEAAVAETAKALKSGARLAGILWHQGESDAHEGGYRTYRERLAAVVRALRSELGAEGLPFVVGELADFQGESDSKEVESALTYAKWLRVIMAALIARIREAAETAGIAERVCAPLPVLVGELGEYLDGNADSLYHREINAQLAEFAALRPEYALVRARDLPDRGDRLHFSAHAQRRLGIRYACAWMDTVAALSPREEICAPVKAEYV